MKLLIVLTLLFTAPDRKIVTSVGEPTEISFSSGNSDKSFLVWTVYSYRPPIYTPDRPVAEPSPTTIYDRREGNTKTVIKVNGKVVDRRELLEWFAKTKNAKVEIDEDTSRYMYPVEVRFSG